MCNCLPEMFAGRASHSLTPTLIPSRREFGLGFETPLKLLNLPLLLPRLLCSRRLSLRRRPRGLRHVGPLGCDWVVLRVDFLAR